MNFKITDNVIKITAIIVILLITIPTYLMLNMLSDFKNTVFNESQKKSILVIDTIGETKTIKLADNTKDVFMSLSISHLEKMFKYDYISYINNIHYIKNNFTKDAFDTWLKFFKENNKDIKFKASSYNCTINKFTIKQENQKFTVYAKVVQDDLTSSSSSKTTYVVVLDMIYGNPTINNKLAIYVNNVKIMNSKDLKPEEEEVYFN